MGVFIARISKRRTIREFILGVMIALIIFSPFERFSDLRFTRL